MLNKELVLALAGVFQAAALVRQFARHENYDHNALQASSFSLLRMDADSAEEIFGSVRGLRLGLSCIENFFGGRVDSSTREIFQYTARMHHLSLNLRNHRGLQTMIEQRVAELQAHYLKNDHRHDQELRLQAEISVLYGRSISTLTPRIMIQGVRVKLENPLTINRIRTALFCGIRAAWLWQQLGGRRWQVIFQRQLYRQQAQRLLGQLGRG